MRIDEGGDILTEHPELAYPNTDIQYQDYYAQMPSSAGAEAVDYSSMVALGPAASSAVEDDFASYYAKQAALSRLLLGSNSSSSSGVEAAPLVVKGTEDTEEKAADTDDGDEDGAEEDEEAEAAAGGWQRFKDEATGAFYYFNLGTGESSWQDPTANVAASADPAAVTATVTEDETKQAET